MVNTRRTESSSVAPDNGQRYETTKTTPGGELGSSCDSINGEQEEDDSVEEDSWSSQDKANLVHLNIKKKSSPIVSKVRELRGRFVCDEKKFNRLHLSQRRVRRGLIYTTHKMRNMINSDMEDVDVYSPKRMRKNRYISKREARINRRAALSLRPITQKSYKDGSPALCNSEDSHGFTAVRRSTRTRHATHSWIGDDQMHKIGYPNLNIYSDDDSNDAGAQPARKRRRCQKYMYSYKPAGRSNPSTLSQGDKENHQEDSNLIRSSTNIHKRTSRSSAATPKLGDALSSSDPKASDSNETDKSEQKDAKQSVVEEGSKEGSSEEKRSTDVVQQNGNSSDIESNSGPRTRLGTRKRKLSTSSSETAVRSYSLRDRRPKAMPIFADSCRVPRRNEPRRRFSHTRFNRRQSTSDTDSSDSDCRHNNSYGKAAKSPHSKNEQLRTGAGNVLPIAPETLDPQITFKSVGGLREHVQCLKEMVLLPMMYPDVFAKFQIQPSRGVLFHGPPGTGKTLLARALANECSFGTKKVSFYMRKGADLLSKWIGESEKQLRVLFEQAAEKKPSIIFFDELDGLAPVRSSRQDQVHASIVSTLLALMDGLTNRGEVIVIGATNRIDAIDPALRRPGRFDRELFFPLPSQSAREDILRVHLSQWNCPPSDAMVSYLAENSVGYCGSDLRALCSEAVIQSFRRTYPQVYMSEHRLVLEPDDVKVEKIDFLRAKSVLVPASYRVAESVGCKLTAIVQPLLEKNLQEVISMLQHSFPHGVNSNLAKVKLSASLRPAQMLLAAENEEYGNTTYLAPALLHRMEHIHSYVLDLAALHCQSERSPESACVQVFREAKRNVPSIIYIPNIDSIWQLVSETVIGIFMTQIKQIGPNTPILLLATSNTKYLLLPDNLRYIFSAYRNEVYTMEMADDESRTAFFQPLIMDACRKPLRADRGAEKKYAVLPRAPTPPPAPLSQDSEKKLYETEERTLRELRIFLRDICKKLASNRVFYLFTKPVDTEEVPDYTTIIKEPMDLETMMLKVDYHRYECAKDFLNDIDLICRNALEYNPARTSADKQIRHRACSLRDYAYTLIENEMDSDFEEKCQDIAEKRKERNVSHTQFLPPYLTTPLDKPALSKSKEEVSLEDTKEESVQDTNVSNSPVLLRTSPYRRRKINKWQRGCIKKKKKASRVSETSDHVNGKTYSEEDSKDSKDGDTEADVSKDETISTTDTHSNAVRLEINDLLSPSEILDDPLDIDDIHKTLNEKSVQQKFTINVSESELNDVLNVAVALTKDKPLTVLLDLHFQLSRVIRKYMRTSDRRQLTKDLLKELKRFKTTQIEYAGASVTRSSSSISLLSQVSDHCNSVFTDRSSRIACSHK